MDTLSVVITEILLCLAVAWGLGFLAAWILFRRVQKEYEEEIEELEENLSYLSASNKNQEREIIRQNLKIQEFEKTLGQDVKDTTIKETVIEQDIIKPQNSKEDIIEQDNTKTQGNKEEISKIDNDIKDKEMLKLIEDNLYFPQKK